MLWSVCTRANLFTRSLHACTKLVDARVAVAGHEVLDVALALQPEFLLDLHFHPQPLAVEAVLVAEFVAGHGEVAVVHVLVGAAPGVVDAHRVVRGDRAVEEAPASACRRSAPCASRRCRSSSQNLRTARSRAGKSTDDSTFSNGIASTSHGETLPQFTTDTRTRHMARTSEEKPHGERRQSTVKAAEILTQRRKVAKKTGENTVLQQQSCLPGVFFAALRLCVRHSSSHSPRTRRRFSHARARSARRRSGHHQFARRRVRRADLRRSRGRATGNRPALPARRLGGTRAGRHLVFGRAYRARGTRQVRPRRDGRGRHRHHQPARNRRGVGPHERPRRGPRDRVAGPPHHRLLPRARGRPADAHREDRPRPRPVLLRHQS